MAAHKDYFISYNKADRQWARVIRDALEDSGKSTVMQETDFHAGSNFPLEMHKALKQATRMIGILSNDYLDSEFCQSEWAAKFREDPVGKKRLLIFAKVKECALDGLLASIVHINLVGLDVEAASEKLLGQLEQIISAIPSKAKSPRKKRTPAPKPEPALAAPQSPSIFHFSQNSTGDNAHVIGIQNIEKQFVTKRTTMKNVIQPDETHISPAQRAELHKRLQELGEREAKVAVTKKFPEGPQSHTEEKLAKDLTSKMMSFLRSDFNKQMNDGQAYHLLPKEKYEAALSWIAQRKAMKRSSLRRTDNEEWRRDHEKIIWGEMRKRKWEKADVYAFTVECGIRKIPITSLKELPERELKEFANAMKSKKGRKPARGST